MSRIVMAVIALIALSFISVNMIQEYVIDRANESKDIAKLEPQKSANPPTERNAVRTANGEGQAASDAPGFIE